MNAQATEDHPTETRTVESGPGGMYVEASGIPGLPAIVFIHGAGQSGREWREHMRRLSAFHCLAPDLPGFGRSNQLPSASFSQTADLIAKLIEQRVPARRASVVGISSGGMIIHALLRRHPDRVERAIIDGTPVRARSRRLVALFFLLAPLIHTRPVLAINRDTHDPVDLRAASRRAFGRAIAEVFRTSATIDAPCPTLLIAGEMEAGLQGADTRETNAALATLMPHGEAWYAPGLFHCWQRVTPDLHIRTVEAWVGGQALPSELRREAAPSPEEVERMRRLAPENRYVRHKGRLMRLARFYFRPFRKPLIEAYGKAAGEAIARDALGRFEVLLLDIPYIGGGKNAFTITLVKIAAKLAMYRTLRARGASVEEAARLIHLGEVGFYESVPTRWLMRLQGRGFLTQKGVDMWRRIAATSQGRRYPGDWVYEVVEGDGSDSGLGLDCIECGAVKYLDREGAPELAEYLCWIDYPQFAAMHLRLDRTETIAQGGQRCDFRVSRGQPVQVEPEFLHP